MLSGKERSWSGAVLITGAAGNLGSKLRAYFGAAGNWELRLLDLRSSDPDIVPADLSVYDASWADRFAGVNAVIHLAGEASPEASVESAVRLNVDLSLNVMRAVAQHNCPKLIFASSNWVMAGYRFTQDRLTTDLAPRPINPYGWSKLFIERAGLELARRGATTFVAFRIGYCLAGSGDRPGPHMGMGLWGQQMWLSDRDLCQGFEKALSAGISGGVILNLMSNNPGMRWDLDETRKHIGFVPQDGHRAIVPDAGEA